DYDIQTKKIFGPMQVCKHGSGEGMLSMVAKQIGDVYLLKMLGLKTDLFCLLQSGR
ncbi:unnamed protein product, partial [Prorocentrum cordatum]